MSMSYSYPPDQAWEPLADSDWNAEAAKHLLRRAGWTATADEMRKALGGPLEATLDRLFPAAPATLAKPAAIQKLEADQISDQQRIAAADPADRRLIQRELREHSQQALLDLTIKWMEFSALPANSAFQKWVLFLSDIYVVGFDKVPRAQWIFHHFDVLAKHALGPAPALAKAVLRSPAMVLYLDLQQNQVQAPNENFARELLELFTLGEGNYTEQDIKQSAKAFTGYRLRPNGQVYLAPRLHDSGPKTVFGQTGNFSGDDIIDLAFAQPAAGAFVPHEMVKFYLSDTMLPKEYLTALGDQWRTDGAYDLRWLAKRFFGSRLFYAPEFRGDFIKSPIQFYLGLVQDLQLDVLPAPRFLVNPLRQMGQQLFTPPNVRGWVGGRNWINSASIAARNALVESLFAPFNERALNQDELVQVVAAKGAGQDDFTVDRQRFSALLEMTPEAAARHLAAALLPAAPPVSYVNLLTEFIAGQSADENPDEHLRRLRRATVAVLQSPEYQLC